MTCYPVWTTCSSSSGKVVVKTLVSLAERITSTTMKSTSLSSSMFSILPPICLPDVSYSDNWVSRDMNGTALENAPFEAIFRDPESGHRFQRHLPIQVQSCWNGIAVLDPAPMYAHPHVRFRMARLGDGECSASECSLICNDYWEAGYGRILMVPRVKLAYDKVRLASFKSAYC